MFVKFDLFPLSTEMLQELGNTVTASLQLKQTFLLQDLVVHTWIFRVNLKAYRDIDMIESNSSTILLRLFFLYKEHTKVTLLGQM